MNKEHLFNLNFKVMLSDDNFKEDSVREEIILPIIKALGFKQNHIIRSKTLQHLFLKIGSTNQPKLF